MTKTALVLGGGGTKGTYTVGVIQALNEMNIPIDIVTGTSIGALIGALYVQGDFQSAYDFCANMKASDVTLDGISNETTIENFMIQKNKLPKVLKTYIQEKGADITPLKESIERLFDYDKFIASPIDYGLTMTKFPNLERVEVNKDGMTRQLATQQILASTACFPAFPMVEIDGETFMDGGYSDNCPMDQAIRLGATELIVVDLSYDHPNHANLHYYPNVKYILPSRSLGRMLSFNPELIKNNIRLGYLDTMRAFGKFRGFTYTFKHEINKEAKFLYRFQKINSALSLLRTHDDTHFLETLCSQYRMKDDLDFDYRICEIIAEIMDLPREKIYTLGKMQQIFKEYYHSDTNFQYIDFVKQLAFITKDNYKDANHTYFVGCIYHHLKNSTSPMEDINVLGRLLPKETLAGLYIYLLENEQL